MSVAAPRQEPSPGSAVQRPPREDDWRAACFQSFAAFLMAGIVLGAIGIFLLFFHILDNKTSS